MREWTKPELVVLVRSQPGETVLQGDCRTDPQPYENGSGGHCKFESGPRAGQECSHTAST
jgi:hypothetical protein